MTSPVKTSKPAASKSYRIRSGDTLWAIASRLQDRGVKGSHAEIIRRIQSLNPSIKNPNLIFAGRTLKLPGQGLVSSDGFSPSGPRRGGNSSGTSNVGGTDRVSIPPGTSGDAIRAQIAQWAVQQANDPNIGYSQTKGRFGNATDSAGHRYFDCSGLVYTAYKKFGIDFGANWTGAMQSSWPKWADKIPKSQSAMKPGDLILMNGHVVMYIGNGKCVGAQTSHTAFKDQVTTNINVQHYLSRPDAIVLRPKV